MNEFFAMGGYGAYVWTAYGVTLVALVLLFVWSRHGAHRRELELDQVRQLTRAGHGAAHDAALDPVNPAPLEPATAAGSSGGRGE